MIYHAWEAPTVNATVIDDRRRLVLPPRFAAKSAVTVQDIDEETVLVKISRPSKHRMVMLLPDVQTLPADPAWDKVEAAFTRDSNKGLSRFEE
jgi:hypothetical protein